MWARNGRELFYMAPNGLNGVTIAAGTNFKAGSPTRLIERRYFSETAFVGRTYDVSSDGQRFLMIRLGRASGEAAERSNIIVVQGWFEELKRLVPSGN